MLNSERTTCSEHTDTRVPFFSTKVAQPLHWEALNAMAITLWEKFYCSKIQIII